MCQLCHHPLTSVDIRTCPPQNAHPSQLYLAPLPVISTLPEPTAHQGQLLYAFVQLEHGGRSALEVDKGKITSKSFERCVLENKWQEIACSNPLICLFPDVINT